MRHTLGMASDTTSLTWAARLTRLIKVTILGCVVATAGLSAGSAAPGDEEVPYQSELPTYSETGLWVTPRATGLNYATTAAQWIRLPPLFVAAYNRAATNLVDNRCPGGRLYPYTDQSIRSAALHFSSSGGAPSHYGYVGPFPVRTVAFGSIPVEAQIELRQRRDAQNKPIGLELRSTDGTFCPGLGHPSEGPDERTVHVRDVKVSGELDLVVTSLRVDGVDLRLRESCRTSKPATLSLSAPEYFQIRRAGDAIRIYLDRKPGSAPISRDDWPDAARVMETPLFNVGLGGRLSGNVDIPAFADCVTASGEDVSRLLTATVAGPDNPTITRTEGLVFDPNPPTKPLPALPFPTAAP